MRTVQETIDDMGKLCATDIACIDAGFNAGNCASAYDTEDYSEAVLEICGANGFYRVGHMLGFFSSYEIDEIDGEYAASVAHYRAVAEALELNI